jgi:hypothetical protein
MTKREKFLSVCLLLVVAAALATEKAESRFSATRYRQEVVGPMELCPPEVPPQLPSTPLNEVPPGQLRLARKNASPTLPDLRIFEPPCIGLVGGK